jgi:hypothetical protein
MYRNAVRERISFFECGLTVKFLLFHSGSLCWPTVGAVSSPPRRPALAILRKPASGTSTFPIRNALTISAKRLQSGRKHSFVIVDVLCPHLPYFTLMSCVLHPTASLCEPGRVSTSPSSPSLQPSKRACPRHYAGALSHAHALWPFCPVQQSLHLLLTMSDIALIVYLSDRWVTAGPTSYEQLVLRTCLSLKQQSCRLRILE